VKIMTESNINPLPLEVRKLQIENGETTLQVYLNTDIVKEQRHTPDIGAVYDIYTYQETQLSIPLPPTLSDKLDAMKTVDPTWHQRPTRRLLMRRLTKPVFFHALSRSMRKDRIKEVDRKDRLHPIQLLEPYQDFIYLGNPENSGDREPRPELLGEK